MRGRYKAASNILRIGKQTSKQAKKEKKETAQQVVAIILGSFSAHRRTTVVDDRHKAYGTVHKNQFLSGPLTSRETQISRRAVNSRF